MSHPDATLNGCSLEDCHTNLFALTDLAGIKWRKYIGEGTLCTDPLDDHVLASFTRCIKSDILCVWRRAQKNNDHLACKKELWIFWYGDEPPSLSMLVSSHLQVDHSGEGSWEDNGLSYECRTLLFKALHNLIERCLLQQSFVRVGKWFVQPFDLRHDANDKGAHLSIRFSFFLHGESTVCASIDVRQHPPLWRLQSYHLTHAANQHGLPVVLAPYGLAASVTGQTYKDSDPTTQKVLQEYQEFYVLSDPNNDRCAKVVEVIVGGARMRYPTSFILVASDTQQELLRQNNGCLSPPLPPPPTSPKPATTGEPAIRLMAKAAYMDSTYQPVFSHDHCLSLGTRIIDRVWTDGMVTSGAQQHHSHSRPSAASGEGGSPAEDQFAVGVWDFGEPTQKNPCACNKQKGAKQRPGGSNAPAAKPGGKGRGEGRRASIPFHRRNTAPESILQQEIDLCMQSLPAKAVGAGNKALNNSSTSSSIPASTTSTSLSSTSGPSVSSSMSQQQQSAAATVSVSSASSSSGGSSASATPVNTSSSTSDPPHHHLSAPCDSPHSAAPSPLVASQTQPSAATQNGGSGAGAAEATMPTLSPHPPPLKTEATAATNASNACTKAEPLEEGGDPLAQHALTKAELVNLPFRTGATPADVCVKSEAVNSWLLSQQHKGIKRPMLPPKQYDDGDDGPDVKNLYNFKQLNAWLDHPVKRHKYEEESANTIPSTQPVAGRSPQARSAAPHANATHDPYEFHDESSAGSLLQRGNFRQSREDSNKSSFGGAAVKTEATDEHNGFGPDSPSESNGGGTAGFCKGLSEHELRPTMADLNNIFDTSDSESNRSGGIGGNLSDTDGGDPFPPTNSPKCDEKRSPPKAGITNIAGTSIAGPGLNELTRMYPTPPSTENNHNLSPCNGLPEGSTDITAVTEPMTSTMTAVVPAKVDFQYGRLTGEDSVKDWSYVYKPKMHVEFVTSTKYSPIELPSAKEEPLMAAPEYRGSWHHSYHPLDRSTVPAITQPTQHTHLSQHYTNVPSVENAGSAGSQRGGGMETSPATYPQQQRTPRTPLSYELQSPASNASSYLNKNVNSVGTSTEVHSLIVNIMLSDSLLNLFKDQNFDSCPICVCNTNIKGADVGLYLVDRSAEAQYPCMCGFSAVINRRYGAGSGLFYEDEVDITGIRDDRLDRHKPSLVGDKDQSLDRVPPDILLQLQAQFSSVFPSWSLPPISMDNDVVGLAVNRLEKQDSCDAAYIALEMGRQAVDQCLSSKLDEKKNCMHDWPLQAAAPIPENSQDVLRLLKSLQPLLQDAIQKKRTTRLWDHVYTITGPLSWKDFHLLAGRGGDETSEPQPIPALLGGCDKDWIKMAPQAVKFWDKLNIEPHGRPQDIAYIVVAPENDFILSHVRVFFSELCRQYEQCRLGKHRPLSTKLRDATLRIGKNLAKTLADQPVDDWFSCIGDSAVAAKLRLYAQVCKHQLAPFIGRTLVEDQSYLRAIFVDSPVSSSVGGSKVRYTSEPSPAPPLTPDGGGGGGGSTDTDKENDRDDVGPSPAAAAAASAGLGGDDTEDGAGELPAVVVYLVDPFSTMLYAGDWEEGRRLSMLGLLRCYQSIVNVLRDSSHLKQLNIQLQIIPLQKLMYRDESTNGLKSLAMAVYTQCRRIMTQTVAGKSMTGFGPAAAAVDLLKKPSEQMCTQLTLYTPPYIIAPAQETKVNLMVADGSHERSRVLLCAYCLSEDQRWLLAVCTDSKGELLETCSINIEIPNRNRRKKASARRIGLTKLWDFVLSLVSMTVHPWRLVIGRFGRIGHGELKGWSGLLSSKHLGACNRQLRDTCGQCNIMGRWECPILLSACLISMETHSTIHVMPDAVKTEEEKRSSKIQMDTPRDASVTHILVVPTSATAQANSQQQPLMSNDMPGADLGEVEDDDDFLSGMMGGDGMDDIDMIGGDISDILGGLIDQPDPLGTNMEHNHNVGGNEHGVGGGRQSPLSNGGCRRGPHGSISDPQDDSPNLLQQPLAMGFYTSTAKTGPLPKWFWSACPHRENICPTCLKAALHVNSHAPVEGPKPKNSSCHPLESGFTCDVLRYVLETYNALSWLNVDPMTNDRRSCLPIHFVVLMQLYHAINAFV